MNDEPGNWRRKIGLMNLVIVLVCMNCWTAGSNRQELIAEESIAEARQESVEIRPVIERSLAFLEKGSIEWSEVRKCATCHHIPMMLWTHAKARQRGFLVNEQAMSNRETKALAEYLDHPELTPTGQDKGFMEKVLGPGTVYLSLALQANSTLSDDGGKALQTFRENMVARQRISEEMEWRPARRYSR